MFNEYSSLFVACSDLIIPSCHFDVHLQLKNGKMRWPKGKYIGYLESLNVWNIVAVKEWKEHITCGS